MTLELHETVRQPPDGSTPSVRQPTNECDWATNIAIDVVAISHGVTHRAAINSIADILRAVRVAGQRDGIDAALRHLVK